MPREVIRLMANLICTVEQDVYRPCIYCTIYDPVCGTDGMLSESEKLMLAQNERAELARHGQAYKGESWAICAQRAGQNKHTQEQAWAVLVKDEITVGTIPQ